MLKRPAFILIAALLLAAAFLYGVLQLFALRYEAGEVYPPYSTLRADPLGAKALYEALGALPGVSVERNFRPLPKLQPSEPVTLAYAGCSRFAYWSEKELETFEKLVRDGSRAVFAFFPMDRPPREEQTKKDKKDDEDEREGAPVKFAEVAKRWGFAFETLPAPKDKAFDRQAATMEPGGRLEPNLSWHSATYFTDLAPEWRVLYTCELQPVVIERAFGDGTLLLAADSFFLSNEALRRERHPLLLARVFSGPRRVVFDEEHLGVREDEGIATLARKYRLHGVVAVLALLAVLFVWKNAARFLPARDDEDGGDVVAGKEASEGFVNLLRRTIKPSEILGACVDEWRKSSAHRPRDRARLEEAWAAEQARPKKERSAIGAYRDLANTLARK